MERRDISAAALAVVRTLAEWPSAEKRATLIQVSSSLISCGCTNEERAPVMRLCTMLLCSVSENLYDVRPEHILCSSNSCDDCSWWTSGGPAR